MARQQIAAQALGVLADEQATLAEHQLVLNATQTLSKGTWAGDEFAWGFKVASQIGAGGRWLDVWGKILGVPRTTGEADQGYGQRILIEIAHASSANAGIAWSLDQILGTTGTQVIDAASFLAITYRANMGLQANNKLRANNRGRFLNTACCYVVRLTDVPTLYSVDDIEWIVKRLQAAGTRLVCIQDLSATKAVILSGPTYMVPGQDYTVAATTVDGDSVWAWTVAGAAVVSEAGDKIVIRSSTPGTVSVGVTRTTAGVVAMGGATYESSIRPMIILGSTHPELAGTGALTAYMDECEGYVYAWTIENGFIVSGQGTHSIVFGVGQANKEAGASATLRCVATDSEKNIVVAAGTAVDVLPYPRQSVINAGTIAGGGVALGAISMAYELSVTRIVTSSPARVRLYETSAQRSDDLSRPMGDTVAESSGLIVDAWTDAEKLDIPIWPEGQGGNGDAVRTLTIYWAINNMSTSDAEITAQIHYRQEA